MALLRSIRFVGFIVYLRCLRFVLRLQDVNDTQTFTLLAVTPAWMFGAFMIDPDTGALAVSSVGESMDLFNFENTSIATLLIRMQDGGGNMYGPPLMDTQNYVSQCQP
jgi:hypothetical protein